MQPHLDGSRSSLIFRRRLAARLVALGAPTALAAASACNGGYGGLAPLPTVMSTDVTGSSGGLGSATGAAGQAPSTSSTGGSGAGGGGTGGDGTGGGPLTGCFPLSMVATPDCPPAEASQTIDDLCQSGWGPLVVYSAAPSSDTSQCCYVIGPREVCGAAGRPFLVDEQARVAEATFGAPDDGWQATRSGPSVEGLSPEDRAALATAWAADALLEHASVASFSRLSLALMAAGAPSDLVELAHKAALDEVRHAQLCFGLASVYAGVAVGPGAFPFGKSVHVPTTLAEIAVSAVVEGCVGETVAAVVAAEQLARATDPSVRAALAEIAADEARHAELAWKTVAWAVQVGGAKVRSAAARALFDAIAGSVAQQRAREATPPPSEPPPAALTAHGRLDEAITVKVAAAAMTEVVAPAAWAVFHESDVSEAASCASGETPVPPSAGKLGDRH